MRNCFFILSLLSSGWYIKSRLFMRNLWPGHYKGRTKNMMFIQKKKYIFSLFVKEFEKLFWLFRRWIKKSCFDYKLYKNEIVSKLIRCSSCRKNYKNSNIREFVLAWKFLLCLLCLILVENKVFLNFRPILG